MPVNVNHPIVLNDLKAFNWQQATTFTTTVNFKIVLLKLP